MKQGEVKNLKKLYDSKHNSFTIMSIVLSLLIVFYHCYFLYYGPTPSRIDFISKIFRGENTGALVVAAFSVISGFMITSSIERSKNIKEYVFKRIKRIFPAFAIVLIISALVVAPIVSTISFKDYYIKPSLYMPYIIDNLLLFKNSVYGIGDAFLTNPYPSAINGSIWYIKHQFLCYLYMIPIFLFFIKNKSKNKYDYKYFFILILSLTILSYSGSFVGVFRNLKEHLAYIGVINEIESLVRVVYYFSAGVFLNVYKDKVMYDKKNLIFASIMLILTFRTRLFPYFCLLILPYFIIYLGTLKSKIKVIDISYYIFLVGFPVQQVLMNFFLTEINIYLYIGLSLTISIICGYILYKLLNIISIPFKKEKKA